MSKSPKIVRVETIKPRLVSLKDAARYLGLAPKTLRNRTGPKAVNPLPLQPRKIGGKVLFLLVELDLLVDSLQER